MQVRSFAGTVQAVDARMAWMMNEMLRQQAAMDEMRGLAEENNLLLNILVGRP